MKVTKFNLTIFCKMVLLNNVIDLYDRIYCVFKLIHYYIQSYQIYKTNGNIPLFMYAVDTYI